MEILSVIGALIGITDGIVSLRDKLRNDNDKQYFVQWLTRTGDLLSDVAKTLEKGDYPHTQCSNLLYCLKHMYHVMEKHMSKQEAAELHRLLGEAHQVERLWGELTGSTEDVRKYNLQKLYEAAGVFNAAADYVLMK